MATIDDLVELLGDGKANAIHASEIERQLRMEEGHTQEPTRDLIRNAIVEHNYPIGSTAQDGYFLIDSEDDLNEAVQELRARIVALQRRIDGMTRGWQERQNSRQSGGNWPR